MSKAVKQAVIMAGGKGTRLLPYTHVLPKPLMPIGEKPILEYILRQLSAAGIDNVYISLGYKGNIIQSVVGCGEKYGLNISYYTEKEPLGTMGVLALLPELDDNFLVLNGDLCTDLQYKNFADNHLLANSMFSVSVFNFRHRIEFGVIDIDFQQDKIDAFREKPEMDLWVSMGIYAMQKDLVNLVPKNTFWGFDNMVECALRENIPVHTVPFRGRWCDIGRPEDYFGVQDAYEKNGDSIFGL